MCYNLPSGVVDSHVASETLHVRISVGAVGAFVPCLKDHFCWYFYHMKK